MGRLGNSKLFLWAKATPWAVDHPRAVLSSQGLRFIRAARIHHDNLRTKVQRLEASLKLARGIEGNDDGGKRERGWHRLYNP